MGSCSVGGSISPVVFLLSDVVLQPTSIQVRVQNISEARSIIHMYWHLQQQLLFAHVR